MSKKEVHVYILSDNIIGSFVLGNELWEEYFESLLALYH